MLHYIVASGLESVQIKLELVITIQLAIAKVSLVKFTSPMLLYILLVPYATPHHWRHPR